MLVRFLAKTRNQNVVFSLRILAQLASLLYLIPGKKYNLSTYLFWYYDAELMIRFSLVFKFDVAVRKML